MKTFTFSGFISVGYNEDYQKISLVQDDGSGIDLISRFQEIQKWLHNKEVQVNYWISKTKKTKDEMLEGWLKKLYGIIDADYESEEYHYSSYTRGTYNNSTLKIGGHDLFLELESKEGKYIIFEINYKD